MIEQVMQQKKRYEAMVKQFTEEHFKGWFIEFFKLYPFITKIQWVQHTESYSEPEIELASSYLAGNKDLKVYTSDFELIGLDREVKTVRNILPMYRSNNWQAFKDPALASAVKAIEELFKAEDVLLHVFGDGSKVTATAEKIEVEDYD